MKKDDHYVRFLQWALPRMNFRWPGFRKVRGQVKKRIRKRFSELGLQDLAAYRGLLGSDAGKEEWAILEGMCKISISRFYRDEKIFETIGKKLLPDLARQTLHRGETSLRCWSLGCASGEEPYSLVVLWRFWVAPLLEQAPEFTVFATDLDTHVLERAKQGCYQASSVHELPRELLDKAFTEADGLYHLKPDLKKPVTFKRHDIRRDPMPEEKFHLILCRNLAFTYFDQELQTQVVERIKTTLAPGGVLVIGCHESLSQFQHGLLKPFPLLPIYQKLAYGE